MDRIESYRRAFALEALKPRRTLNGWQLFGLRTQDTLHYMQVCGVLFGDHGLAVYRGDEEPARLIRLSKYTGHNETGAESAIYSQRSLHCRVCTREMMDEGDE